MPCPEAVEGPIDGLRILLHPLPQSLRAENEFVPRAMTVFWRLDHVDDMGYARDLRQSSHEYAAGFDIPPASHVFLHFR